MENLTLNNVNKPMAILNEITTALFIGFGFFILVTSFIRFPSPQTNEMVTSLTTSAIAVVRLAAAVWLITWAVSLYEQLQSQEEQYATLTRLTGPYWLAYWMYPISFGIFPQLLWIKHIKRIKVIRVITALLFLFVTHLEKIIIIITSMHRDYIPASWTTVFPYRFALLYNWVIDLVVFFVVLAIAHFMRLKLAKNA